MFAWLTSHTAPFISYFISSCELQYCPIAFSYVLASYTNKQYQTDSFLVMFHLRLSYVELLDPYTHVHKLHLAVSIADSFAIEIIVCCYRATNKVATARDYTKLSDWVHTERLDSMVTVWTAQLSSDMWTREPKSYKAAREHSSGLPRSQSCSRMWSVVWRPTKYGPYL